MRRGRSTTEASRRSAAATVLFAVLAVAAICHGGSPICQAQQGNGPEATDSPPVGQHAVVVELFTSQGCSTCPPADRLLTDLGQQASGRVIPLAFHVDFWNHDGWTDPFSSREWTERQVAYARALGLRQVYTPQAVVDGAAEFVGSDEHRLRAEIAMAGSRPAGTISLHLEPAGSRVLVRAEVSLPEALRNTRLDLMLAVFETELVTSVSKGENGGRTLRNDYVVRSLERADKLPAGGSSPTQHLAKLRLASKWNLSRLGVAAFLQDPRSLEIHGATARPFPIAASGPPPSNP